MTTPMIFLCIATASLGIAVIILYHMLKATTKRLNGRIQHLEDLHDPKAR